MTALVLKRLRLKAGMTQKVVADAMGVSQPNYQRWESGSAAIPESKQKKLALVLGTSVDEILGKPPAFDLFGVDPYIKDDRTYFGEVAIHFSKGAPILLPITEEMRSDLLNQLCGISPFIVADSLDNRRVFIRRGAIMDVYFSSEAYDTYGPDDQDYPDHLGVSPDDDFWKIVEFQETPDLLEGEIEQERIAEVLSQICLTNERLERSIADGHVTSEDRESVAAESAKQAAELTDRACNVCWQFSSGQVRREPATESKLLYEVFSPIRADSDDLPGDLTFYLPLEGYHRTIVISGSALDYIWIPKHKFYEGLIDCAGQELDETES